MAEQRFAVVFKGKIVAGADPAVVRENLARLFKINPAKVEAMFSGKPVLIKKDLDRAKAETYELALSKAGAIVELMATPAAAAAAPAETPSAAHASDNAAQSPTPPPPPPKAPDLTIAEPGVTLVEHEPVPPAEFDTSQFDLAEVGATLTEAKTVTPPEFDTSGMTLDPPGTDLAEPRKVPRADFDTSALSLAQND
jgi:hypothetical protein